MNADDSIKRVPKFSRGKRLLFSGLLLLFSTMIVLSAGELYLRYRNQRIARSNYFDPGHIVYDSLLGWKLTPNWTGRHRHHDFDVGYSTNRYSFRGDFPKSKPEGVNRYAIVGDSFTFSYGVNDNETFINLLNQNAAGKRQFLNFGVPGYSTDQELLLIKESVLLFQPDVVVLVVYLGNDLFDNLLSFPLQADRAKPFYSRSGDHIILENVPVPITRKPSGESEFAIRKVGIEGADQQQGWLGALLGRVQITRLVGEHLTHSPQVDNADFKPRFQKALDLFYMIVDQIEAVCRSSGVELRIVLMPGQSFVTTPRTLTAPVQDFFRQDILSNQARLGVPVLDLSGFLRKRFEEGGESLFHPHEGHLNRRGHEAVAEFLDGRL